MVVLLLHACLVLGIIAVPGFVRLTQSNAVAAVSPLCILLSVICTWCVVSWAAVARYVFCPYTIFLLAAILFNASQAFLQVADLNQSGLLSGRFPAVIEAQTLYLVLLGLSGLHLGAARRRAQDAVPYTSYAAWTPDPADRRRIDSDRASTLGYFDRSHGESTFA